uniref:Protein E7 n=1 Tax=Human papillomavirus TaxID=10566 RepID=A0A385PI20_9PAPI|nr:MAG: E7 protein [Human papillomavirus]
MIGKEPTINDIELDLDRLVLPDNLLCSESLSPDTEGQEEERAPYRIETCCKGCETGVRLCVYSTREAIQTLQQILISDLSLFCPACSRNLFRDGRSQ